MLRRGWTSTSCHGGKSIVDTGLSAHLAAVAVIVRIGVGYDARVTSHIASFAAHKGVGECAVGWLLVICCWRNSATKVDRCHTYSNTILSVIDSTTVGKYVYVGAFRSELAVTLCEIFANILGRGTQVMIKRTGVASLTGALSEELARNVRGIGRAPRAVNSAASRHGAHESTGYTISWSWYLEAAGADMPDLMYLKVCHSFFSDMRAKRTEGGMGGGVNCLPA